MKEIRLPGLNGVRFIAALLVILDHSEIIKSNFGFETIWSIPRSHYLGIFGVMIFFVLSGFLITYLLLMERENKSINIKHFYIRRILRIWPLYFLIVGICFCIIPHLDFFYVPGYTSDMHDYGVRLALFSGMMANVAFVYFPTVAFANILWSVAVEEQFYLLWPHVMKIKKNLLSIMVLLLFLYVGTRLFVGAFLHEKELTSLLDRTRFSSLIIGGIGAYFLYHKSVLLKIIYDRRIQMIAYSLFALQLTDLIHFKYYNMIRSELTSVVIGVLIINIASNPKSLLKLENPLFNYLGKISYGLYVFHSFAIVIAIKIAVLSGVMSMNTFLSYPVILAIILIITILISHVSYHYFEKLFLKRKVRYSFLISGDMIEKKSYGKIKLPLKFLLNKISYGLKDQQTNQGVKSG